MEDPELDLDDPAFFGDYSLLATDQGIRGFLFVTNDLLYVSAITLRLSSWTLESIYENKNATSLPATENDAQNLALASFENQDAAAFVRETMQALSSYDWRISSTPGISDENRRNKLVFRGSSGYKELRHQLLTHLIQKGGRVGDAAQEVLERLGYL